MNYFTPGEAADAFRITAINKSRRPLPQFAVMAILGGAFIAFGGLLTVIVAGGMPEIAKANPGIVRFVAGTLFPVGLIIVSITGADLFTSNCAGFTFPLLKKEIPLLKIIYILTLSYLFNFVGAQFVAYLLSANVGLFSNDPWQAYLHSYSAAKVNQPFMPIFMKGIGANWLVCLGMFMGFTAKDTLGKCIGIWIPVMMFVTMGYEHSIANMFFIPAAIYSGAGIAWSDFLITNLVPSTLGNIVGGMLMVGCVYYYLFLKQEAPTGLNAGKKGAEGIIKGTSSNGNGSKLEVEVKAEAEIKTEAKTNINI